MSKGIGMIHSMTAYAREEVKGDWGTAVWELRSVNQRYLETNFRLPEQFRAMEIPLRDKLKKALHRGKVECNLRFNAEQGGNSSIQLNEELAREVIHSAEWLQSQGAKATIDPLDILRWPGVISSEEADMDTLQAELLAGFDKALSSFLEHRAA